MFRKFLFAMLIVFAQPAWSQDTGSGGESNAITKYGPRRQIATIVYMGLGGAVLGLSTLSFYGRPQDKLTNIPIGFGIGVIIGTVYMTYQAATNPQEFYRSELRYEPQFKLVNTEPARTAADIFVEREKPSLNYAWSF